MKKTACAIAEYGEKKLKKKLNPAAFTRAHLSSIENCFYCRKSMNLPDTADQVYCMARHKAQKVSHYCPAYEYPMFYLVKEDPMEQFRKELLDYVGTAWATLGYPVILEYVSRLSNPDITPSELVEIAEELNYPPADF